MTALRNFLEKCALSFIRLANTSVTLEEKKYFCFEILAVLKPSWEENEEAGLPVAKKMKNSNKPEKTQEDNNNGPKISPQDWPPSLK